jgi:hypothetical protein
MDINLWLDESGAVIPEFYQLFQNFVGVQPLLDTQTPEFIDYATKFQNRPLVSDFFTAFRKAPNTVSALAFDATFAMARAWHDVIEV